MFGLFWSNPVTKLEELYAAKLVEARDLQRKGDIVKYAQVSAAADSLLKRLEAAESTGKRINT